MNFSMMNSPMALFVLTGIIVILLFVIFYQRFLLLRGREKKLKEIARKLGDILENDSDEKVMVFTDDKALMEVMGEINRLLDDRQKIKAGFRREEAASKKMLSNISHDMKTPLTVILGYLEILRLKSPKDEALKKTEAKAKQVLELINRFFTLAKLEAGDTDMELKKFAVNELCRENILSFYDILQQRDFQVEISVPEKELYVHDDEEAVQRILQNLLSNALRYGSDGKYLGFFLREDEAHVYIDIADKGKGIDKESAAHVFDRLYTMEDSRNREIQGTGLGLTIAKNLAKSMGGDIILNSIPYEKTIFTLELCKPKMQSV